MTAQATDTSVHTSIVVEAPIERAFWDINTQWQLETDLERTSEVEARFVAEESDRTRVELEHRNLDRHGDGWEQMRDAVGSPGGWSEGMKAFAERMAT